MFALRIIEVTEKLPNRTTGWVLGKQLLRSATSVSANYRAARRARSSNEYVAKISIVVEESDEAAHWLDLIQAANLLPPSVAAPLLDEADQLTRIFAAIRRTAIDNRDASGK